MSAFVHIVPVYNRPEERVVDRLSHLYSDRERLCRIIEGLLGSELSEAHVRGKNVLIKPNWVKQSRNEDDEICLRTNDNFILATLEIILRMRPAGVRIGDAPIQGCNWNKMISARFAEEINRLSAAFQVPVEVVDFRRRTYDFVKNRTEGEIRPMEEYLIFDLGEDSLLEPITVPCKSKFRVTNYDPDRMEASHYIGTHRYCIAKEFFEADVILSLPKVKTHQKTAITGAMKNLVGINGDKDFLPHHRIGGSDNGGDCYPGRSYLRFWSELSLDRANRRQGKPSFWFWKKLSSLLWRLSRPGPEHQIAAGWYGNDTSWRMVKDLNKIAVFGDAQGKIHKNPQRQIFTLSDGIIGGQGDGPLEPDPLPMGLVLFSNHSLFHDRVVADLMNFPREKIPLLSAPHDESDEGFYLTYDGKDISRNELAKYSLKVKPPLGWISHLK
ncbi:MAG: DUF362 domain-containing protein [Bacteroidales bacterium]|nr:DUF362 domain-containing protein [Bacteroidales bacterium]